MRRVQIIGTIGSVLAIEVLYVYAYGKIGKIFQTAINFDIVYFIFAILSAVLFTLLIHVFFRKVMKINSSVVLESRKRELLFEGITYCIMAYTHIKAFFNETAVFDSESFYMPWHMESIYEWFVIALAGVCIFECRKIVIWKLGEYQNISLKVWYLFLAAVASYSLYQPNCFMNYYNVYHTDAYFNSVYRVLHLQPYSEVNTGVYGFYGIILAPITKLLGGDFRACIFALMILTFISIICYFYVLDEVAGECTVLKVLASICIIAPLITLTSNIYLQLWPHRIIFMGYILAFIVWRDKRDGYFKNAWIGYILMVLSLVWNFEIGLGCILAYWGSDIVKILQRYSLKDLDGWKKIAWDIIQIPVTILCAWLFAGCYNFVVDHSWVSISVFLFPFIGNSYMSDLNISLSQFISPWMLVLFVILISIIAVVLGTNLCGKYIENRKNSVLAACTIGVAVQMLYFINRSVYGNLYIVLPVISLIIAYWVERFRCVEIWNSDKLCNGCFRAVCIQLVSVMILVVLMTVCQYFPAQSVKNESKNMVEIKQLMSTISEQVPKDTFGIGVGIPELYSYLGWNTGYYGIDMADFGVLSEEIRTDVIEKVTKEENIFSNKWCLSTLFSDDMDVEFYKTHDLVAEFTYGDMELVYYTKNAFFDAIDN